METPSFTLHWGIVSEQPNQSLYALFPSPVNDDVCFAEAGHCDFQSDDADYSEGYWDAQAAILHQRVWSALSALGAATLCSPPLYPAQAWWQFWHAPAPLPLMKQLELSMYEDNLPTARVRFGSAVEIETDNGHQLYWIRLLPDCPMDFATLLTGLKGEWVSKQVMLDWQKLR
ncbi:MAG: hypothetical protein PHU06_05125 [Gallionella sp.]|nr:hypothetical protein [Gallionella sp.]MDD4957999.1 hypothetical protein [Gallionella sp.]